MGFFNFFKSSDKGKPKPNHNKKKKDEVAIPPGRVSVPEDNIGNLLSLREGVRIISPSFKTELIDLLRKLYKVNPDVGIAIQDMFKLSNTGHLVNFPNDKSEHAEKLRTFLVERSKTWSTYTAGINGLINKLIVQCYVTGAIAIEAIPDKNLDGISTIVLLKPENIVFERTKDGKYEPYQKVTNSLINKDNLIKLNEQTFTYVSMFNDIDEPYGIPPFLTALDSLDGQAVMKTNFKQLMENAGLLGFMEATIEKSPKRANESESAYIRRLENGLNIFKTRIKDGMADGVIVGHNGDHEFKFNSTTKDMANVHQFWNMNQQSVANGLGVSSNLIGVQTTNTEGGAGIMLSKLISQLRNIQMLIAYVLERIYNLELRLAGLEHKGIKVSFGATTVSDELKIQQGLEIKIRNLNALYLQGIISQEDYAWEMGYIRPHLKEPLVDPTATDLDDSAASKKREADKDKSDRTSRDKSKPVPKRKDQDTKPR